MPPSSQNSRAPGHLSSLATSHRSTSAGILTYRQHQVPPRTTAAAFLNIVLEDRFFALW